MSLLFSAWRHLRAELPINAPEVSSSVSSDSFMLAQQYLGSAIIFFDRRGQPALIYKTSWHPSLNHFLDNAIECAGTAQRHGFRVQPIYASGRVGSWAFAAFGWMPGVPLKELREKKGALSYESPLFLQAVDTIAQLHRCTRRLGGVDLSALRERMEWWRDLVAGLGNVPGSLLRVIDDVFSSTLRAMENTPVVLMHGDYVESNIVHEAKNGLTFIDWELGLTAGLPAVDLVSLLLDHARLHGSGQGRKDALSVCFLSPGSRAEACKSLLAAYGDQLGLSRDALRRLIAVTHIKMLAEDRHWLLLHQGPVAGKGLVSDLLALEDVLAGELKW